MNVEEYLAELNDSNFLEHYGIKGMKWGVRRYQNKDGSLTSAGKQRYYTKYGSSVVNDDQRNKEKKEYGPFIAIGAGAAGLAATAGVAVASGTIFPGVALSSVALIGGGTAKLIKRGYRTVERKKYEQEREDAKIDSKSGLKKKSRNMTEKEDLVRVNNDFYDFKSGSKNNCAICSVTYDLSRRGYEVRAKRAASGYTKDEMNNWFDKKLKYTRVDYPSIQMSNIRKQILSQGEGARGSLNIMYGSGGHAVTYVVRNGKIRILDAQSATEHSLNDVLVQSNVIGCTFARWDNVPINFNKVKAVVE